MKQNNLVTVPYLRSILPKKVYDCLYKEKVLTRIVFYANKKLEKNKFICRKDLFCIENTEKVAKGFLGHLFSWHESSEGHKYWRNIHFQLLAIFYPNSKFEI